MSGDCVVDASVGIKLLVQEELSEHAERIFARLARPPLPTFYVPDHFFIECSNVLWKYVRRFDYEPAEALQGLAALRRLPLRSLATRDLAEGSLELGLRYGIAAYDAAYVVLAEMFSVPLVTADRVLFERAAEAPCEVLWLGNEP